ncbi:MAG: phytanoyl-CoA dioxygenase family protein [candidate division Zixibacteria bacterium]|nr:phytanoyl-CoA dioxygenase family protein [candidate division Zixibacteria bacterium]
MLSYNDLLHYHDEGYVLIERAVPEGMLMPLRAAGQRITERTRRGDWPHKRAIGDEDIWGRSDLLRPEAGEPVFSEYMASAVVLETVAALLGVSSGQDTPLQLELVNMLVNPVHRDFEIGWHRDLVPTTLPPEEEYARLLEIRHGVQWNTALYDDVCLRIVPGSHIRASTEQERDIVQHRSFDPMPNEIVVRLEAGQGVYYNANLLHRVVYAKDRRRETIHACIGTVDGAPLRGDLYTWLSWMCAPEFEETLPSCLRPLYENFVRMAKMMDQRARQPGQQPRH